MLAGAAGVLRLWRGDLEVPLAGQGDALFNVALVKALAEHGWWTHNPDLGWPAGQDLHDFAMGGDHVHLAGLWALGRLTGEPGLALNLAFLLALALAAVTSYAVLRWLGAGRLPSLVGAVLFALAPSAFLRGETHITLLAWPVPVGAWLALRVWLGRPLPRGPALALLLAACAVVASTGSFYFAAFVLVLVAAGVLARPGAWRGAAVTGAAIVAVLVVNALPTLLYAAERGRNDVVAARFASESEFHGLKLAQLVLPVPGHRLTPLAELRGRYEATGLPPAPTESYWSVLGGAATVGLVWLLVVLLGRRGDERHRALAGATLVAFLVGTVGGLGAVLAYVVTPQLRGWNRISAFLAFFALAALVLLLDAAARRARRRALVPAGLALVLGVGLLDQTSNALIPDHAALEATWRSDEQVVERLEAALPAGAAVLQLPVVRFPEPGPVRGVEDYDPLRPYLHSERLRWSHGAMAGRPEDWHTTLAEQPLPAVLRSAQAAGFAALWLDREGFADGRVEEELRARLGAPVAESGRFAAWRLPRAAPDPVARERTLRPLRLTPVGRTSTTPLREGEARWGVAGPALRLRLDNPLDRPRPALLRLALDRRARDAATIEVRLPGGAVRRVRTGEALEARVVAAPGRSTIELRTAAAPGDDGLAFRLAASVTDEALLRAGPPRRPR